MDLIAVRTDDFDAILSMEFLAKKGLITIPSTGSLLIMGEKPASAREGEAIYWVEAIVRTTV